MHLYKVFTVSSSLAALRALRSSYFSHLISLERAELGHTTFGVVLNDRSYLQNLGVPPNSRHHPSSSSLYNTPFFMRIDFCHAYNQYILHRNGTTVDLFVGPSRHAATSWDCTATVAYVLGFKQLASGIVVPQTALNACQRRLIRDVAPRLEELLAAKQLVENK